VHGLPNLLKEVLPLLAGRVNFGVCQLQCCLSQEMLVKDRRLCDLLGDNKGNNLQSPCFFLQFALQANGKDFDSTTRPDFLRRDTHSNPTNPR
jgi:hypothetical protein